MIDSEVWKIKGAPEVDIRKAEAGPCKFSGMQFPIVMENFGAKFIQIVKFMILVAKKRMMHGLLSRDLSHLQNKLLEYSPKI